MVNLNLAYPNVSDILFKTVQFPDGQQDIVLQSWPNLDQPVTVRSRMNSFKDIELIICANKALRNLGYNEIHLSVPYFLGARSDRKFTMGGNNYLKDVVCPVINLQKFATVTTMDPHSDVVEACTDNFRKINNVELVKWALTDIDNTFTAHDKVVIVSPDSGAVKKGYHVAKRVGYTREIITAAKVRNVTTGQILYTSVPMEHEYALDSKFVMIDDICDTGRTFTEVVKVIKQKYPDAKQYLIVTHGVFSTGFDELAKHFDYIYTTNSIADVTGFDFVKQMNVY